MKYNFVTISSTGNATDFGDLTTSKGAWWMCQIKQEVIGGGYPETIIKR